MRKPGQDPKKLSLKDYATALWQVAALTARTAPGPIAAQVAGAVLTAVLPLATAYLAARTVTALGEAVSGKEGARDTVVALVVATAVLGLVQVVWGSLEGYLKQVLRYRVDSKISDIMYERFASLEFWRYDDKDTADTFDRAKRFTMVFSSVFDRITTLITTVVALATGAGLLFTVSPWLVLLLLLAVGPGIYLQLKLSRLQLRHWNENVDSRRVVTNIEWRMLRQESIAEVRLYGLVRHILDLRARLRDQDKKQSLDYEKRYMPSRFAADGLEVGAQAVSLVWVVNRIVDGLAPLGSFVMVQQVVQQSFGAVNQFVSMLSTLDEDLGNLMDYRKFLSYPTSPTRGRELRGPVERVEFRDVRFHYPRSSAMVLDGVDLTLERGRRIALVGENGAGKSTLVKILTGLYKPVSGSVLVDGVPLEEIDPAAWHAQLGVLRQDYLSFDFATARDNIVFGAVGTEPDPARVERAVEGAEAGFLRDLPKGLDSYVSPWMGYDDGVAGTNLSGGQWQRLAFARSLYRDAPILVLDEPTSAIDALAESRIMGRLFEDRGRTLVLVSHRLSTLEKADEILMLEHGAVVERGTYAELVRLRGRFWRMFRPQLEAVEAGRGEPEAPTGPGGQEARE